MRIHLALAVALGCGVALTAGCGTPGADRDLFHGGGLVDVANTPVYRVQTGLAIPRIVPGTDAGYFITAASGGFFRLVWSGDVRTTGLPRHLYGSLWTTSNFSSVTVGCDGGFCPLEPDSYVSAVHAVLGGSRVDWDVFASDGLGGFDFVVDAVPVYFDFFVDDQRHPELVLFPATDHGGTPSVAGQIPFGLTPQ